MSGAPPGGRLRPVPPGGHLRVVSVSGRVPPEPFARGVARLRERGYRVTLPNAPLSGAHDYLAGGVKERLDDFIDALSDPTHDAILCARGGFGAMHLLRGAIPHISAHLDRPFVGFSDITALHLMLSARGLPTLHGPVVTALGAEPDGAVLLERLVAALEGRLPTHEHIAGSHAHGSGRARGPLGGGNLSLLSTSLGIPGCGLPDGAIALIEEVNEAPYRLDRMVTGLLLSGALDRVAGVALGSFSGCGPDERAAAEVVATCLAPLGVPLVAGLPIGHGASDLTVPLGTPCELDTDGASLRVTWPFHER